MAALATGLPEDTSSKRFGVLCRLDLDSDFRFRVPVEHVEQFLACLKVDRPTEPMHPADGTLLFSCTPAWLAADGRMDVTPGSDCV